MAETIVDGEKRVSTGKTSKRGYPIVETGALVDCHHCDDVHEADYRDGEVGYDVPGGHKRWSHFTCPNTGYMFAAKKGSKLR